MNERIIVVGIVTDKDSVLIGKKAKGRPPYPDVWHTLGGGVDDFGRGSLLLNEKKYDDSYFHSELARELMEEANISVKNIRNICPIYRESPRESVTPNKEGVPTHYVFLEYLCELDNGTGVPGSDIAEVKWVKKEELKGIPLTPPSMVMYRELKWI